MNVRDMQDATDYGHREEYLKWIEDNHRMYQEKTRDEATYHSQVSFIYSMLHMPAECKKHASLVPEWAKLQEKLLAMHGVARMLVFEQKLEEAISYYQQINAMEVAAVAAEEDEEEKEEENVMVLEEAAWCCLELKQYEAAKEWFTKGTKVAPDWSIFWEGIGRSLALQERYTEALLLFEKALEVGLTDKRNKNYYSAIYHDLIGQCYGSLNDFYRALDHYTKSLEADPTYANALNDMAALYFNHEEGDMGNAIHYLKQAEEIAYKEENMHTLQMVFMNLATIYKKIGEFELAEEYQQNFVNVIFGGMISWEDDEEGDDGGVEK